MRRSMQGQPQSQMKSQKQFQELPALELAEKLEAVYGFGYRLVQPALGLGVVSAFFDNIPHEVLLEKLAAVLPDASLLPYAFRPDFGAVYVQASALARHARGLTTGATVGIGAGQMSRVDSTKIASIKATKAPQPAATITPVTSRPGLSSASISAVSGCTDTLSPAAPQAPAGRPATLQSLR